MARRFVLTVLVTVVAILAGFFQFSLRPKLSILGWQRVLRPVGNTQCKAYPEVQACEKLVLHQPTGLVYLACSTQQSRPHWIPAAGRLNATGKSSSDYVAFFDPSTSRITRLKTEGFKFSRGLSLHGMDVVPSKEHPEDLLIYLVNHREPIHPADARKAGADSVIEVFRTSPGADAMHYVATFQDPVIATPNDIWATGDDMSFYFTNDYGFTKLGLGRSLSLDAFLDLGWSNVGYCHALEGCKIVAENLMGVNGITRDKEGRFFVGSSKSGRLYVLDQQTDKALTLSDVISLDRPIDNLFVDQSGAIWAAGMVNGFHIIFVHFENPSINSPSSALRFRMNNSSSQKIEKKYNVETIFEDDGDIASGTTSVAYDAQRKKLYLHGIAAPHLTVCDIDV